MRADFGVLAGWGLILAPLRGLILALGGCERLIFALVAGGEGFAPYDCVLFDPSRLYYFILSYRGVGFALPPGLARANLGARRGLILAVGVAGLLWANLGAILRADFGVRAGWGLIFAPLRGADFGARGLRGADFGARGGWSMICAIRLCTIRPVSAVLFYTIVP